LLNAAVFAAAAQLVVARVPHRHLWLPLAIVALPALPLVAAGGFLPRPGGYAVAFGLLLVVLYAAGYTIASRHHRTWRE